jgi:glutamine amidotransferase
MCRLLGYFGPPIELHGLIYGPSHGLEQQSWAPRRQIHGTINADGWGIGWYDRSVQPEPARYRTTTPLWADQNFASVAPMLVSECVVAAVRDASPGMPVDQSSTAPFSADHWLFAHNGLVEGFRSGVGTELRRSLTPRREAGILGGSDSEVLFALLLDRLDKGLPVVDAIRDVVAEVRTIAGGRLNLLVSDGSSTIASRAGDTLFVWTDDTPTGPITLIASEPLDDDGDWIEVPDDTLVIASRDRVPDLQPL